MFEAADPEVEAALSLPFYGYDAEIRLTRRRATADEPREKLPTDH